jgi:hypothetical protein
MHTLSYTSYEVFARAYYASDLLFIVTIYLAKLSLILFIMRLTPSYKTLYFCYGFVVALTLWMLGTVFLLAFQCPLPQPWDFMPLRLEKCAVDIARLYFSIGAVDILTDLIVIVTPAVIVWNVQISRRQRFTVIGVFSSRLAVCICSALLLASLPTFLKSRDRSWEAVRPQTWRQVVQCLSIITACIPCLRPFLASLESGFMDSSMQGVIGRTYGGDSSERGGKKKGPNSSPLTSFAAGSHRAIIVPRNLKSSFDIEKAKSDKTASSTIWAGSVLSPRSLALSAPRGSVILDSGGVSSSGPKNHSCNCLPLPPRTSAESQRDHTRPHKIHGRKGRSTDSINVLASRKSGRLSENTQAQRANESFIRETREVIISIEREGSRLIDGSVYTPGSATSSTPVTETPHFLQEHSGYCLS